MHPWVMAIRNVMNGGLSKRSQTVFIKFKPLRLHQYINFKIYYDLGYILIIFKQIIYVLMSNSVTKRCNLEI